jgi:single-strand DNA-binding protein
MFGDVNKVTLMGNITNDPDLRYTPSGTAVISFGLATNRRYRKQNSDEWTDEPTFHNIVIWRNAESLAKRIRKGTRLYLEGRIQTRSWEDNEGNKKYKTEVIAEEVVLIARYEGANDQGGSSTAKDAAPSEPATSGEIDPNDLPF